VDGLNAKVSFGGLVDGNEGYGASGAVTVPLGHRFGLQIDAAAAEFNNSLVGNVPSYSFATHAFWRDPSKGLLGFYGDYNHLDTLGGLNFYRLGAEAALYRNRITIDGIAGVQHGTLIGSEFFDRARFSYYPTDNLQLNIGHAYSYDEHSLQYGLEWAFANPGRTASSLFAAGGVSDDGDHAAVIGVRLYLGQKKKTLIRRHREDDPPVFITIQDNGTYTFIFGRTSNRNVAPNFAPLVEELVSDRINNFTSSR
jgi:hypothetical protein